MSAGDDGLNPEQRAALGVDGVSVALSAGAGCGKTRVLTDRFLRDLDGPNRRPLREVVALTFTEKAARELRGRVRVACRERFEAAKDVEAAQHWRKVLRELEAAPIGTFHGFCRELLARHAVEAGIDPQFGVLEESIAPALRDRALASCLRRWLARGDEDLFALAVEFGLPRVRDALADLVGERARTDLGRWARLDAAGLVAAWEDAWREHARPLAIERLREAWSPAENLFAGHECSHPEMRKRIAFLIEQMPALADADDPLALLKAIRDQAKVQGGGTKAHWPSTEVYDRVKSTLNDLRKAIDKAEEALALDADASAAAAETGLRLARLAVEAIDAYDRAKHAAGLLDFDDLLLKARDLLRDGPEAARTDAVNAIGLVLVDEFQDTDPIQAEILELLLGAGFDAGRLYLVGDKKQSIYRFRRADPSLFEAVRERLPLEGRPALARNYRSAPGIIAFANALFEPVFGPEHRLEPARDVPPLGDGPAVAFVWATEAAEGHVGVDERRRAEARRLARYLAHRLESGWTVWDRAAKDARPAHAGDVAILFRTLNDSAAYESALLAEGLDYYVSGGSAFFAQQEVLDLVNLLATIDDPHDPLALAASLRSPFLGVSDEGLLWLASAPGGDLVRAFHSGRPVAGLRAADRVAVERARELLGRWRALKDRAPIADLVARVLEDSGYEAALLAEFLGDRKRANGRKLARLARRFDRQGEATLAAFVHYLREGLRRPPREDQAATSDESARVVRLMTIHQAKGLEFPIVVVPDLGRELPNARDWPALHPQLGPLVRPPDGEDGEPAGRSLGWEVFKLIEEREDRAEAHRLFYVAATRARDWLILSAGLAPGEKSRSPALELLHQQFNMTDGTFLGPIAPGQEPPAAEVVGPLPPRPDSPNSSRRRSVPRLAVARRIERAEPEPEAAPSGAGHHAIPRFVDLDPADGLNPSAARLDRLIRAALADPELLRPGRAEAVIRRAARSLAPSAPPGVVAEALDRLGAWSAGRLAREVAASVEVRRAIPWAVAWPPGDPDATVIEGQIDLAFRDRQGDWCLLAFSDPSAPEARERLRLRLSARAAADLDLGPVARGWLVRPGPGGGLRGEDRFDDDAIHSAWRAFLAGR